jgi:WD40 repeat protein
MAADGSLYATGGDDQTVRLWDATAAELRATLSGHTGPVTGVAIAADGSWLASASADGTARLWTVDTAKKLMGRRHVSGAHAGPVLAGHTGPVTAIAIAVDGTWLATGGRDHVVRLWDASGAERDILLGHDDEVLAVAIARDGGRLVSAGRDQTIRLWDSVTGVNIATMRVAGPLRAVCWAPDGRSVFAAGEYGPYRFDIG